MHKIIDLTMRDVGDSKDACFLHFDRLGLLKADQGCWMMYTFQGFDPWGFYPMEPYESSDYVGRKGTHRMASLHEGSEAEMPLLACFTVEGRSL